MKLIIEDDEGRKTVVPIVREEITIGRQDGNTIKLSERNVSRKHARLVRDNGFLLIEDLGSSNGVRVNGDRIEGRARIKEGDLIEIGDYDLGLQGKLDAIEKTGKTIPPGQVTAPKAASRPTPMSVTPVSAPLAQPTAPAPAPQSASLNGTAGGATAIIRVSDVMKAPQVELRDLQKTEMPRLVGLAGAVRGKEFYLMRTEVKFGRTDENDVVVDHQSVSRQHARFVLDADGWKVIDNKSANGVKVNGDEYGISAVRPGDTIELGHLKFRFCAPGEKFSLPQEKTDGDAKGPKPTTAELIAGAQGRSAPAAPKKGSKIPVVAGLALLVVAAVAFVFLKGKKPEDDPKYQIEQGDLQFRKHDYAKAMEYYEQAVALGATPANMKRAAVESKAQETHDAFQAALASDPDKAKALFDRCAGETTRTHWCGEVTKSGDELKQKYAAKHVGLGSAAKAAGKLDQCVKEANLVLAFVPENAEAQGLASSCQPAAAPKEETPKGPSPAQREAKAARLASDAKAKLLAKEYTSAIARAKAALAENPSDKSTLSTAYMALGYGYAYTNDKPSAKKYLQKYLPYCVNGCEQVQAYINGP